MLCQASTLGIFSTSIRPGTVTQSPSNASKRLMSIVPGFSGDLQSLCKSLRALHAPGNPSWHRQGLQPPGSLEQDSISLYQVYNELHLSGTD